MFTSLHLPSASHCTLRDGSKTTTLGKSSHCFPNSRILSPSNFIVLCLSVMISYSWSSSSNCNELPFRAGTFMPRRSWATFQWSFAQVNQIRWHPSDEPHGPSQEKVQPPWQSPWKKQENAVQRAQVPECRFRSTDSFFHTSHVILVKSNSETLVPQLQNARHWYLLHRAPFI